MRLTTIAFLLTCFLALSPAMAQNWGPDDEKPPEDTAVETEVDTSFAMAATDVAGRRGLTRRQKVELGLTPRGILKTLRAIHADGELEGRDTSIIAADILSRSAAEHPKAYMDANVGVDWEMVIEWIEKLLPFLLMIFSFMS